MMSFIICEITVDRMKDDKENNMGQDM